MRLEPLECYKEFFQKKYGFSAEWRKLTVFEKLITVIAILVLATMVITYPISLIQTLQNKSGILNDILALSMLFGIILGFVKFIYDHLAIKKTKGSAYYEKYSRSQTTQYLLWELGYQYRVQIEFLYKKYRYHYSKTESNSSESIKNMKNFSYTLMGVIIGIFSTNLVSQIKFWDVTSFALLILFIVSVYLAAFLILSLISSIKQHWFSSNNKYLKFLLEDLELILERNKFPEM